MMKNKSILISGASIAGPALAYWLVKYGFTVTIVEHTPTLRGGGYGVDIRGAAIEVVRRMGILDEVRAADTAMQGMYMVDDHGKRVAQLSEAASGNKRGVDIEIMRDDLSHILYDLTKQTSTYIWNDSIASMTETQNGVEVKFESGKQQNFDFVVGADGLHSNVRRQVFGDESQFVHDMGCYISIFTLENYLRLDHCELIYSAPGHTAGMYSARNNTEAKGLFIFQSPRLKYPYHDTGAQKKIVTEKFVNEKGWEVPTLLKAMQKAPDFYFDLMCQIRMKSWSKGRITLVGDAAYGPSPASGQGTSMALVGAYILAGELKKAGDDYTSAFSAYENKMLSFVKKNQKIGLMMVKNMVVKSSVMIKINIMILRIPGFMNMMQKKADQMVSEAANGVELETY